jgi:hypothetical protein
VVAHSLTLSHTPESMKCDSQPSHLAHTFVSLCLGHEPKARVATLAMCSAFIQNKFKTPPPMYSFSDSSNDFSPKAINIHKVVMRTRMKSIIEKQKCKDSNIEKISNL